MTVSEPAGMLKLSPALTVFELVRAPQMSMLPLVEASIIAKCVTVVGPVLQVPKLIAPTLLVTPFVPEVAAQLASRGLFATRL